jgi:signal transduction histidine kinase
MGLVRRGSAANSMNRIIRRFALSFLYAGLVASVGFSIWSLLRTETYRQQTEIILSQAAEVRWRVSQSREKIARIMGYLELAVKTGEEMPFAPLAQEIRILRFNLKSLAHLDYAEPYIGANAMLDLHGAIRLSDSTVLSVENDKDYRQALRFATSIDTYLVQLFSLTIDNSQTLSSTSQIASDAEHNRLRFFGALTALILCVIGIDQYNSSSGKRDQHIKSFSQLFAHMTRTRIAALRLFLGYLDGKSLPQPEMTEAAMRTILELASITEGLMTIGHARAESRPATVGTLIDEIARSCKLHLHVEADSEARAVRVPASQFHLLIDELVGNSINAVAARPTR